MIFKIDIFTLTEKASHSSDKVYFGSIVFRTGKDLKSVFDFLHYGGGLMAIEGIEIITFDFEHYSIIQLTDFLRGGDFYKNLIYNNSDFQISNSEIKDKFLTTDSDYDYLIIGDDSVAEMFSESDVAFLKDYEGTIIKSDYLYEWGSTAYWEKYFASIASGLTLKIIDKLTSIGFPESSIQSFKLPQKIKEALANEYKITVDSLFLESYDKDENGKISTIFRNTTYRFYITMNKDEMVDLKTENLNKYV